MEHSIEAIATKISASSEGAYAWVIKKQYAEFHISVTNQSDIEAVVDWMDNLYPRNDGLVNALTGKIKNTIKSKHFTDKYEKRLILKKKSAVLGKRGSINSLGSIIYTASPGTIAYDWTLPDTDELNIPIVFLENTENATLDVYFEDNLLGSYLGSNYETNVMEILTNNIAPYKGQSGTLMIELNVPGSNSARIYIPDSIKLNVEDIFTTEHMFTAPEAGEFQVFSEQDKSYAIMRSTNLLHGSVEQMSSSVQGDGSALILPYNDSGSGADSAFFWVEQNPISFAPDELAAGSKIDFLLNGSTNRTYWFGENNQFTNINATGWYEGTNQYFKSDGISSELSIVPAGLASSGTVYYLVWTNSFAGSIFSVGDENISELDGFSFVYNESNSSGYAAATLNNGDIIKIYNNGVLDQTCTFGSGDTFTNDFGDGADLGVYSYTHSNFIISSLLVDYPALPDSETTYTFAWINESGGTVSAEGETTINQGSGWTFQYIQAP